MKVFITGASSGIGEALARHYAGTGATLGLVARRGAMLETLLANLPGQHHCYVADVTDPQQMADAAAAFIEQVGLPDIVIANAGVSVGTLSVEAEDIPAFHRVLETNLFGMLHTFQPFIAPMQAQRAGKLVGIASVAGIRGLPGAGAYSASKAASISYLESLRIELRGSGVSVITIAPGYIETPMTAVNSYSMPFVIPADVAAPRFARAIARGTSYTVIPWQMGIVAKLLRLLPNPLFDYFFSKTKRKPRQLPL